MRFDYEHKQRAWLVSLGGLLSNVGASILSKPRVHFEQDWPDRLMNKLVLGIPMRLRLAGELPAEPP